MGRVVVVTGAVRGIGAAIAARFANDGDRVVVWDRDAASFDVDAAGFVPAHALAVDVADPLAVERAHAETVNRVGEVAVLVNNAGISGPIAPLWNYPVCDWARVLAINLGGVFHCCRVVVPGMRRAGYGRVVNVASIAGKEGTPNLSAYAAAKHGVLGLTKTLGRELAGTGVLVNCVTPAMTDTPILDALTPAQRAAAAAAIPLGRLLSPQEVAAMVAWIAGPECSFTTGFAFDLSGGRADY